MMSIESLMSCIESFESFAAYGAADATDLASQATLICIGLVLTESGAISVTHKLTDYRLAVPESDAKAIVRANTGRITEVVTTFGFGPEPEIRKVAVDTVKLFLGEL